MKKIFLIILLSVWFLYSCNNKNKNRIIIAEKIEYDVPIITNDPDLDWWVKNIEGSKREAFLRKLSSSLLDGKLKVYDYTSDRQLTSGQIKSIINDVSNKYNIINTNILRFTEKWYIDTKTLEFTKKVLSVSPIVTKDSASIIALFRIKFDTVYDNKEPVSERIRYDVNINNPSNNADWWVENIEASKKEKLINLLLDAGVSGKYRTFDYYNEPLPKAEIKKLISRNDTIRMQRPYPPYDIVDTIIHHNIIKKDITRLRFMEEWFYDANSNSLTKKVKGLNPIVQRFDESTGEFRGYMPMFWIYLDEKYPIK